jgi:hypothetical protein
MMNMHTQKKKKKKKFWIYMFLGKPYLPSLNGILFAMSHKYLNFCNIPYPNLLRGLKCFPFATQNDKNILWSVFLSF